MIQTVNMGKMNIVVVCLCDKTNNFPMLVWWSIFFFYQIHMFFIWKLWSSNSDVKVFIDRHDYLKSKYETRAPDNFQVQRVITPYFWKWCVFAYFLCTVVLSTSKKCFTKQALENYLFCHINIPQLCSSSPCLQSGSWSHFQWEGIQFPSLQANWSALQFLDAETWHIQK
jgi:hypothetical protein